MLTLQIHMYSWQTRIACWTHHTHVALEFSHTLVLRCVQHHGELAVVLLGLHLIVVLQRHPGYNDEEEQTK